MSECVLTQKRSSALGVSAETMAKENDNKNIKANNDDNKEINIDQKEKISNPFDAAEIAILSAPFQEQKLTQIIKNYMEQFVEDIHKCTESCGYKEFLQQRQSLKVQASQWVATEREIKKMIKNRQRLEQKDRFDSLKAKKKASIIDICEMLMTLHVSVLDQCGHEHFQVLRDNDDDMGSV